MNPNCDSFQELLAAECGQERPWSAPLEDHLRECEQCAAFAARLARTTGVLRGLRAVGAPEELRSRVVSACQAGFQEDRAVAEVSLLTPQQAPAALDRGILQLFEEIEAEGVLEDGVRAPEALEERVAEDLEDLPRAVSRRTLEKLPRLATPELLTDRVDQVLPSQDEAAPKVPRLLSGPWATLGRWTAGLGAAAGLIWMVGGVLDSSRVNPTGLEPTGPELALGNTEPAQALYSFEVVRPTDPTELSGQALALARQVSGGVDLVAASANRVAIGDGDAGTEQPRGTGGDETGGDGGNPGAGSAPTGGQGTSPGTGTPGGAGTSGSAGSGASVVGQGGPAYFDQIADAPFNLAYRGERDVTIHADYQGLVTQLVYRELVASDGAGSFTVEPLQVISPVMDSYDEDRFLLFQQGRAGFFFKHRDFRVRDEMRFWENYRVQDLGITQVIAGRTCDTLLISRQDELGNNFTVAIDPTTSLVMSERRTSKDGALVSSVEYRTFELAPDYSDLQMSPIQSSWTPTDLDGLGQVVAGDPLIPVAPPQGFELQEVGYQTGAGLAGDETWVQLTYGDGVEQTFFLFRQDAGGQGNAGSQASIGGMQEDLIRSMTFGPWAILDGRAGGRDVVAVGRVLEDDLLLMLQSSLD